jgi:hypothetical protein
MAGLIHDETQTFLPFQKKTHHLKYRKTAPFTLLIEANCECYLIQLIANFSITPLLLLIHGLLIK